MGKREDDGGVKGAGTVDDDGNKWIQNMPNWNPVTVWFTLANCAVLSGASTALWYSEGQLVPNTIFYNQLTIPFQEFSRYTLSIYAYCSIATAVVGILVAVAANALNKSRQRTLPERYPCDTAHDVFLTIYLLFSGVLMCFGMIVAAICSYLWYTIVHMPADCPGTISQEQAPPSHCSFDNTAYMLIHGAIASNQLAEMWSVIEDELQCCGYYCNQFTSSQLCRDYESQQLWQMESCYMTVNSTTPVCRLALLHIMNDTLMYPVTIGWSAGGVWLLLIAFACQFRVLITNALKEWVK